MLKRRIRLGSALAITALSLAACGGDDSATTATPATNDASDAPAKTSYPVTIDNCGAPLEIPSAPEKVVTVDTSLAETLVALGVSDRIIGTYFDFKNGGIDPANRKVLDTLTVLGKDGYPSREAVISLKPDFVFAFGDSDFSQEGAPTEADLSTAGATIYRGEAFGCEEGKGSVESSFDEIRDLGIIFDRQAEAAEIIAEQQTRLSAVAKAVEGESKPKVIYWDAYDFENIRLLPFGNFQDAVARAGGEILFADVTDDKPVSKEQIATSEVEVVLAIDYGADTTTPLLPDMRDLVKNTPAGKRGEQSVVAVTNFPPNLQSVSLVEAIAKVLHPDKFS